MARKNKAFEEEGSAAQVGHNSQVKDALTIKVAEEIMELNSKMADIRGKIKDKLNYAKENGILKTSVKDAVKILGMTEEQYQAKKEVEAETRRIVQLFVEQDGQYSFLNQAA